MVSLHHLPFINSASSLFKKKFRYNVQRLEMIMWNIESFRQQQPSTEMLHTFSRLLLPTSPQLSSPRRIFSFLSKGACLCVHLVLKYLLLWLDNRWEKSPNKYFQAIPLVHWKVVLMTLQPLTAEDSSRSTSSGCKKENKLVETIRVELLCIKLSIKETENDLLNITASCA